MVKNQTVNTAIKKIGTVGMGVNSFPVCLIRSENIGHNLKCSNIITFWAIDHLQSFALRAHVGTQPKITLDLFYEISSGRLQRTNDFVLPRAFAFLLSRGMNCHTPVILQYNRTSQFVRNRR